MSQVNKICRKYKLESSNKTIQELREILSNRMGYFSTMAQWVFEDDITISDVKYITDILSEVKINKPITKFKSYEELSDHLRDVQNKRKLNQVIKSIPSGSRRNVSNRIRDIIYSNIEKSEEVKDFLSKKGGSCKTEDELYQNISEIINTSNGDNSYEKVLKKINKKIFRLNIRDTLFELLSNCWNIFWWLDVVKRGVKFKKKHGEIIYKDGKTIIVRVNTFRLSSSIGSRSWCISQRKSHWETYIPSNGDNIQYFIYQTELVNSKESMIGVTMMPGNSIKAAHYKDDTSCIYEFKELLKQYGEYIKGNELIIKSANDVIKYNITDLNIILSVPNWKSLITDPSLRYSFSNNHYLSPYNDITSNIVDNIYRDRSKYKHEDYCLFMYEYIKEKKYSISEKIRLICTSISCNDIYFKDNIEIRNLITRNKMVNILYNRFPYRQDGRLYRGYGMSMREGHNQVYGLDDMMEEIIYEFDHVTYENEEAFKKWNKLDSSEKSKYITDWVSKL